MHGTEPSVVQHRRTHTPVACSVCRMCHDRLCVAKYALCASKMHANTQLCNILHLCQFHWLRPSDQAMTVQRGGCVQELRALVYPLVQVLLGAARLVPAPRYFPLRLRIAAALQRLADSAGVLVPLAPLLLEMLTWADLAKPPQVPLPWDRVVFLST